VCPAWVAITRPVSPTLADCELTHRAREPIDVERASEQHRAYEQVLAGLGARIVRAPAAPDTPDAVFVEDTAIVLDEIAIVTRPGAATRRVETDGIGRLAPVACDELAKGEGGVTCCCLQFADCGPVRPADLRPRLAVPGPPPPA
jgi:N-dimethylarginine dimethylaminohydrolase